MNIRYNITDRRIYGYNTNEELVVAISDANLTIYKELDESYSLGSELKILALPITEENFEIFKKKLEELDYKALPEKYVKAMGKFFETLTTNRDERAQQDDKDNPS